MIHSINNFEIPGFLSLKSPCVSFFLPTSGFQGSNEIVSVCFMLGSDPIRSEIIEIRFTQVQKTITEDGRSVVAAKVFFWQFIATKPPRSSPNGGDCFRKCPQDGIDSGKGFLMNCPDRFLQQSSHHLIEESR